MKIQNMAIIFIAILLPIILILSSYTRIQIDTIAIHTQYKTKLRDATYDAVTAFQLNTLKNSFSTVSDSMRRDVSASVSTFMSSLAKNIGISGATEETIKPYIPAIVFTMYDGFYIYSPSYTYAELNNKEKSNEEGYQTIGGMLNKNVDERIVADKLEDQATDEVINEIKNGKSNKFEHVLKPYVYYSARYVNEKERIDVIVNYSLDNYMVIYGLINGTYYTRAGYLQLEEHRYENVEEALFRNLPVSYFVFKKQYVEFGNSIRRIDKAVYKTDIENREITSDKMLVSEYANIADLLYVNRELKNTSPVLRNFNKNAKIEDDKIYATGNFSQGWEIEPSSADYFIYPKSAGKYYNAANEFTKWVINNLGNKITAGNAVKLNGEKYLDKYSNEIFGQEKIFNFDSNNDPNDEASIFNEHKRRIIKISIEDNLYQAIASYNAHSEALESTYNFKMPELKETEWDQILKNVCMVSFMQGLQAGTKIFNDYSIVTSTKNKEYVAPDTLYFINTTNPDGKYHKIGCKHLAENDTDKIVGYRNTDFERFAYEDDNKLDANNNSGVFYYYMHDETACYYCMVNSTLEGNSVNWRTEKNRLDAYNLAMAREKYNFYKVNLNLDLISKDPEVQNRLGIWKPTNDSPKEILYWSPSNEENTQTLSDEEKENAITPPRYVGVVVAQRDYRGKIPDGDNSGTTEACFSLDGSTWSNRWLKLDFKIIPNTEGKLIGAVLADNVAESLGYTWMLTGNQSQTIHVKTRMMDEYGNITESKPFSQQMNVYFRKTDL